MSAEAFKLRPLELMAEKKIQAGCAPMTVFVGFMDGKCKKMCVNAVCALQWTLPERPSHLSLSKENHFIPPGFQMTQTFFLLSSIQAVQSAPVSS